MKSTHESRIERNTPFLFENPDLSEVIELTKSDEEGSGNCFLQENQLKRNLQVQTIRNNQEKRYTNLKFS